jgi:hypothetical protein
MTIHNYYTTLQQSTTRCGLGTYENVVFLFVLIYDQND